MTSPDPNGISGGRALTPMRGRTLRVRVAVPTDRRCGSLRSLFDGRDDDGWLAGGFALVCVHMGFYYSW